MYFTGKFYLNNRLFDLNDKVSNRDNCMYPNFLLKNKLREYGYDLSTQDINPIDQSEFVLYNDIIPTSIDKMNKNSYLILSECEFIKPANWVQSSLNKFNKIFTWHPKWVDGKCYIQYFWPNVIPKVFPENNKSRFCCMITANKKNNANRSLYSEREKSIKWFEENHPDEFDLFGIGWDKYTSNNKLINSLLKLSKFDKLITPYRPSYRGKIENKFDVLKEYKFSICYENAQGISGYITEKIFDSLFALCIPIYLGAPDITDHIPANTFIDKRNYNSYDELYDYLKNMSNSEYNKYLHNIKSYLRSPEIYKFTAGAYAETIINHVL